MKENLCISLFLFFFALTILTSCQTNSSNQTEYFSNIEKNSLDEKQAQELEGLSRKPHNYVGL